MKVTYIYTEKAKKVLRNIKIDFLLLKIIYFQNFIITTHDAEKLLIMNEFTTSP